MTSIKHPTMSRETDRKFAVSANRSSSRHRIRYVESGGAGVDLDECAFCQATPLAESNPTEGNNRDE